MLHTRSGMRVPLIANYVGQGWSAIMNIVFIPIYIHYLGLEAYGLIGVFAVVFTASTLLDAGMSATINREMARYLSGKLDIQRVRNLLFSVEIICLILSILAILIGYPFSWILGHYWISGNILGQHVIQTALYLMIATAVIRVIEGVFRGALLGLNHHVLMNGISILAVTTRSAGVIIPLAFLNASIITFFLWQLLISIIALFLFVLAVRLKLPRAPITPKFDRFAIRELRRFAGGVMGATMLGVILSQIDKILVVQLVSLQQFGAYALATAVAAGLYQLTNPVSQSYYPRFTELFHRSEATLAVAYHHANQTVALVTAPVAALLIFLGEPILQLWTGDPALAASAAPLLRFLAIGVFFHCAMYVPYALQLAAGWPRLAALTNTAAVMLFVPALLFTVPRFGPLGAAISWACLTGVMLLVTIHLMHQRLLPTERRSWWLFDTALPWGATMVVVSALSLIAIPHSIAGRLAYFAFVGGSAVAASAAVQPRIMGLRFVQRASSIMKFKCKRT